MICSYQGLEPEPKEPVSVPVHEGNLRTEHFFGTYIIYFVEPESEPELI
jgi:hypothetical protein